MPKEINNNPLYDQLGIQKKQAEKKDQNGLAQADFLKLLMAQVQNQDPLKPQDNGEFLGQMAQFSTVSGLQDMQKSIDNLANSFMSNQALQASSLVGRLVLVPGGSGFLPEHVEGQDRFMAGAIEPDEPVKSVKLEVVGANGELVRTMRMGAMDSGLERFVWDGLDDAGNPVKAGKYSIRATALDAKDEQIALTTHMLAPVDSVTLGRNGEKMKLNVAGFGAMDIDKIREIM
ncbi:MAG: flagellar hook assembly protein FlgD [Gammaproteobacteria bacterium]|nr:flagellar hook assembly protein FlgD [Gammaproteobacteria bacterium]